MSRVRLVCVTQQDDVDDSDDDDDIFEEDFGLLYSYEFVYFVILCIRYY